MATTILEHCSVVPSLDAPIEQSLPLVHFDMIFLSSNTVLFQNLLFYQIPSSKSEFLESIVPKLKTSLSLTLKHFLHYAGKIHFPLDPSTRPVSRYSTGDSLLLTVAESSADFIHLTGNHPRNIDEFQILTPKIPKSDYSSPDFIKIHVLAVQVTLFPNQGICIGLNINHAIGDETTIMQFIHAWAYLTKFNSSDASLLEKYLPFYDRSRVEDANGLDSTCWNLVKKVFKPNESPNFVMPTNYVQMTFIVGEDEIGKLKSIVMEKRPDSVPVSSFTVVSALLWICYVRSRSGNEVGGDGDDDDDEPEYFVFPVDCRGRLNPPMPCNYFGNCLTVVKAESSHGRLMGSDGFIDCVEKIKKVINETVNNEKGILDGSETRYSDLLGSTWRRRAAGVSGSPRFDYYDVDFGWGRPKKLELFRNGAICLSRARDFQGGIQVGLLFTKLKMDSFVAMLNEALGKESGNMSNLETRKGKD